MLDQTAELRHTLNSETAPVQWKELEPHFARGVLIRVSPTLDLLNVGVAFSQDKQLQVKGWLVAKEVMVASIAEAKDWAERDPDLWAVVVSPWILVQERQTQDAD